jgi:hypothetical protein
MTGYLLSDRNKERCKLQSAALNRVRRAREREKRKGPPSEIRQCIPSNNDAGDEYDKLQASFDEAMAELDKELRVQEQLDMLQSAITLTESSWKCHAAYSQQNLGERATSLEKMAES